eukprot:gb/GFBE01050733.1/.p1 GENE.gb/GFBE01050733.1/~~gb/GFBE01050733.1/.p1  ORF type:complete len:346 (+),score=108.09 gb/GFBE01050733.1/:1-1038(+)
MDEDRNILRKPATDAEKSILRNFVARPATDQERDGFLIKNASHLSDKARGVFIDMSPTDQYRVIFDGPMRESRDAVEILYGRVKRFMDMEMQLRALSSRSGVEVEKPKKEPSAKMQELSKQIAHSLANPKYEEVPESERRCAGVDQKLEEEKKPTVIEGTVKGVGGVIEALQKKYALQKGERVRVVAETKDLWKVTGEKTIPKGQVNSGWKWVIKGADEEAKKKADEAARKKAEKEAAERKKKEEEEAKAKEEAKQKASAKSKKRKKSSDSSAESEEEQDDSDSGSRRKKSRRKERSPATKRSKGASKARKGRRRGSSEQSRSSNESESSGKAKRKARDRSRRRK